MRKRPAPSSDAAAVRPASTKRGKALPWSRLSPPEYSAFVACRKNKTARKALDLFEELSSRKGPDGQSFRIPMDVCSIILSTVMETSEPIQSLVGDAERVYEYVTSGGFSNGSGNESVPPESIYSCMIRVYGLAGRVEDAVRVLRANIDAGYKPRHRSFQFLIDAALAPTETQGARNPAMALSIYKEMRWTLPGLDDSDEWELKLILTACGRYPDDGIPEELMQLYRLAMKDYSVDAQRLPSEELVRVATEFMKSNNGGRMVVKEKCTLQEGTNKCSGCGEVLSSVELPDSTLKSLLEQSEALVLSLDAKKLGQWETFKDWVEKQLAKPLEERHDAVIDGANVAHFTSGLLPSQQAVSRNVRINYHQIDEVMEALRRKGRKPVVFLHARHLSNPLFHRSLERKWRGENAFVVVPGGHNDDIFWLYYALRLGPRAVVVSNDQMRDHRILMVQSQHSFVRWRQRHQSYFIIQPCRSAKSGQIARLYLPDEVAPHAQTNARTGSWHFPREILPPMHADGSGELLEENHGKVMDNAYREFESDLTARHGKEAEDMQTQHQQAYMAGQVPVARSVFEWTCVAPASSSETKRA